MGGSLRTPRVSFVATSRNDDHGGDLLARTQWFLDGLAAQAERHEIEIELVLVEWNPPVGSAPLAEVLRRPSTSGRFEVRIVTVPPEVHQELDAADRIPLFQMIAKNVGIRRALGELVVATNVDILFSDELFAEIGAVPGAKTLYRADRHDVDVSATAVGTFDEAIALCKESVIRINRREGVYVDGARVAPVYQGLGDAISYNLRSFFNGARAGRRQADLQRSGRAPKPGATAHRLVSSLKALLLLPALNVNACGDFTMMTRDDWDCLRGYPEWPVFSWNLDSALLYQAWARGFDLVDFSGPIFHIEHDRGWNPASRDELFERLTSRGIPYVGDAELRTFALEMRRARRRGQVEDINGPDWGTSGRAFAEETPIASGRLR